MQWLRSLVVATVLGAGLFFAASDSADARPRWGRSWGYYPRYYSNYGWGGYRGYYGGYYGWPGYYGGYYRSPGWGYSSPGFYFYYR